jgi:ketosteroid isomerase-like protein
MRPRSTFALVASLALTAVVTARADESVPDLLRRQTQELVDAISSGTPAVWERYLDESVRYVDESGVVSRKKQMVEGIGPLPAGVSGSIRVQDFDAVVHGDVAIATYVDDENENFHGHELHCQYRTTDTWRKTPAGWRLIAGQVLALRTDPPAISLPAATTAEYCGRYALDATITYEIRCSDAGLEGQQSGRKAEPLKAEAPDVLFVPGKPRYRKVFLRGPDGKVTGFAERREAWDIVWKKMRDESGG